ncbi:GNAT family N-acetyltransferase [Paenibacillus sp. LHD-117]|uniref:GNAT family N-acetyltransferase n=1 Tax=Paenibacillus sp. LHD-117 TaxID=3071412 RepID=UPI0027DF8318|nr:GNAT family N-acetyltransferase [Paenibacillus sp. LHD-117]MDQ6420356.1 GNAT family N-acetyltransferase [Paenibacillus sp. LHD-117]
MIDSALKSDADKLMPLLLSAIGSIAHTLSGTSEDSETWDVLLGYIGQERNRISYGNIIVDRRDGGIAGMLICYPGDEAIELDRPIRERLERNYGAEAAGALVPECKPGDFYLDAVAVDERYRGQGIAKALIAAFEERGKAGGFRRLSLIVEQYNEGAYALYRKLGFVDDGLWIVSGGTYIRMIKEL